MYTYYYQFKFKCLTVTYMYAYLKVYTQTFNQILKIDYGFSTGYNFISTIARVTK